MSSEASSPSASATAEQEKSNNSHITQSFRDQKQIESFIRRSKLLKIVEGVTDQYLKKYSETKLSEDALAAVLVPLYFEYAHFIDFSAVELLHLAVEEPVQFANAAKYCVYGLVRDIVKQSTGETAGLKSIDIDQVHVQLRFVGLPLQPSLLFGPPYGLWRTGLSLLVGVLSAHTEPLVGIIQSVWFCSTGCTRNKIKSETSDAPTCNSCARPMSEYSKLRVIQHYRLLRLLPPACVETPRVLNKIFRALTVRVSDHTHDCELRLGQRYLITGYYDYYNSAQEFQAWNLIEH